MKTHASRSALLKNARPSQPIVPPWTKGDFRRVTLLIRQQTSPQPPPYARRGNPFGRLKQTVVYIRMDRYGSLSSSGSNAAPRLSPQRSADL